MPNPLLNYLGAGAPSPIQPGTMPAGVPGAGGATQPPMALPPGMGPAPAVPGMMPAPDAGPPQYDTEVQADGSILLRMKNPDGTTGPVVKIINPIKPRRAPGM